MPHDVVDPRRVPVGPIAQQEIPRADREATEGLPAVGVGQLEEVALQVDEVEGIMDAPIRAGGPGFLDRRGVDGPDAIPRVDARCRGPAPHLLRQPP